MLNAINAIFSAAGPGIITFDIPLATFHIKQIF